MANGRKVRTFCANRTCVVRTCSRNLCHHTGRYYRNTNWIRLGPLDCELYKGLERYASLFEKDIPDSPDSVDELDELSGLSDAEAD